MRLKVKHSTTYRYDAPVTYGLQQLRLTPKQRDGQKILSWHIAIEAEGAMVQANGVCQDHAHIFISAMRLLGHPARYVSGYLMMSDREHQEASHAWAEAHFDGVGWVGFDVSNGYSPDERYISIATGLDYKDAAPVSGMRYGVSEESMIVQLQVQQ